jgi:hypothetical protein
MAEGKRPGGLTALAVLNFVFGGLSALGILAMVALLGAAEAATGGALSEGMAEGMAEMELSGGLLMITIVLSIASCALLIVSGVGYIQQKRVLGRTMGSLYGILALAGTGLGLAGGGDFGIGEIIGLIYPVLTLILVNTTFKEDLVN